MKRLNIILTAILILAFVFAGCAAPIEPEAAPQKSAGAEPAPAASAPAEQAVSRDDIIVLYTNDVHCGINDGMGYTGLMAVKNAMLGHTDNVLLVDSGDAVQGGTVGTLSKGEDIIKLMNKLGYDAATPGNHEFDYTMEQFKRLTELADFPYVSANFMDADGKPVLSPYTIKEVCGVSIAFLGISTPKTLTSSTPSYFQDENGSFIYSFCQDDTGE